MPWLNIAWLVHSRSFQTHEEFQASLAPFPSERLVVLIAICLRRTCFVRSQLCFCCRHVPLLREQHTVEKPMTEIVKTKDSWDALMVCNSCSSVVCGLD